MKRQIITFIVALLGLVQTMNAQTVLMEQDVNQDTIIPEFGKNRKHYFSSFVGVSILPTQIDSDSVQLKTGNSTLVTAGFYYKYKVSKVYSLVGSFYYGQSVYKFETEKDVKYNKLKANDVRLELANRFNFGKRGNVVGNYIELGVSGSYVYSTKLQTKRIVDDPSVNYETLELELTGLKYIQKPNYSVHARLGFNKIAITADYRLSDLTDETLSYDLPPLAVGVRLDFGG